MDFDMLERARHVLTDMREDVVRAMRAEVLERTEAAAERPGDAYDVAADDRERELRVLLTCRDRDKLAAIDDALARVDEGGYGLCESCDEDIGEGRLALLPFTRLCVTCQAASEREQAQHSRRSERLPGALEIPHVDDDA